MNQFWPRFQIAPNITPIKAKGITNKMLRVGPISTDKSNPDTVVPIQDARLPHRK